MFIKQKLLSREVKTNMLTEGGKISTEQIKCMLLTALYILKTLLEKSQGYYYLLDIFLSQEDFFSKILILYSISQK